MNKKGFVLVETLVVVIFVLLIFTILYNNAVPLLGRYGELSYYNDLDTTYDLYYFKNLVVNDTKYDNIKNKEYKKITCSDLDNIYECTNLNISLDIDYQDTLLYINLENLNKATFKNDSNISEEIKDYLEYIDSYSKILLLEHNGYISYLELEKRNNNSIIDVAKSKECDAYWIDDMGTSDTSDDVTYISGSKDCIDFNYLWYSGKLWRIVAIYPSGAMKLVTEDAITIISWGSDIEYNGSYIYQWLNEDFKDTLKNADTILENATWNYSKDGNSNPVRPETIATQKTKQARVGLLNVYEYYNAYRKSSLTANYLNIDYYWWLITPYSDSYVRGVSIQGYQDNSSSPSSFAYGVRPSIILQSGISLSGSGSKTDPYKLVGADYESAQVGDYLYERSQYSGEYVKFNGDLYRIVSVENNITKINRNDILRDETSTSTPKTAINKNFASSTYFGKSTNTTGDTYWDSYLNNTWYNSIDTTYKNMMVDGTYYLGLYGSSNVNYKATICKDSNLNSVTIKNCTKYTTSDTDKTYTGKVGLPRVGEMFSAQLGGGYNVSSSMWLITPYSSLNVSRLNNFGILNSNSPSDNLSGARPSINLSSSVKIACNSSKCDGTKEYPYDLSM